MIEFSGEYTKVKIPFFDEMEIFHVYSRPEYDVVESNIYDRFGCFNLKRISAIYLLFNDDELIYIGESDSLSSRIFNHLMDGKEFNKVLFFRVKNRRERYYLEMILIKEFFPKYNRDCDPGVV